MIGVKTFPKDDLILPETFEKRSLLEQMKVVRI